MRINSRHKNILLVLLSNIFKLFSSLLVVFILPTFFTIDNFGYYKAFMLYGSYVGFFHFGFIDGIYLKYGGIDLENLNKIKMRTYFIFFIIIQLCISLVLLLLSRSFLFDNRNLVFIFVIFNILPTNVVTYFQFISQITSRFNEYSKRLYFLGFSNLFSVGLVVFSNINNFFYLLLLLTLSNYLLMFLSFKNYKVFIFGQIQFSKSIFKEIINLFVIGIPLLLGNIIVTLITTFDKVFIENFYELSSFAIYSFGFSVLSIINIMISAISTVLYPMFKKTTLIKLTSSYENMYIAFVVIILFGLFSFFPLAFVISIYLPDYIASISIIRVALMGILFTSLISALIHNFYKVANLNFAFMIISLLSLFFTIILIYLFNSWSAELISIAFASLIGIYIWFILLNLYLVPKFHLNFNYPLFIATTGIVLFYFFSSINNHFIGGTLYISFLILVLSHDFNKIKNIIK
jgi:O-antigen/teichoic acid export membrane protein